MGRQIKWEGKIKEDAISYILQEITTGKSVRSILDNADREVLPSWFTFAQWLQEDDVLAKQYARAKEAMADVMFDELLLIADYSAKDVQITDEGIEYVNHEAIQRDRLRVDTRKWVLSKLNPKKYGDKQAVDLTSGGDKLDNTLIIKHVDMSKPNSEG